MEVFLTKIKIIQICKSKKFLNLSLILLISDIHDATRDTKLAQYVMNVHTGAGNEKDGNGEEIDLDTLKK